MRTPHDHTLLVALFVASMLAVAGCSGGDQAAGPGGANADALDATVPPSHRKTPDREAPETSPADPDGGANSKTPASPGERKRPRFFGGGLASGPQKQKKNRPEPKPQPVHRPSDDRPQHDAERLAKLGIHLYESKRLKLYTDVDPKQAKELPPLLDRAYDAWAAYFGELPPNREKTAFQITGYLIGDKDRFGKAGLIPGDLPPFDNGRHRGYEFWMYEPPWPYYRRHLAVHEATHCFMYAIRDFRFPSWYMEGMAEYFGTHAFDESGRPGFGVMPQEVKDFVGFARIEYVQQDCEAGRLFSIDDVTKLEPRDFLHNRAYAWSWAWCRFLDSHPKYGDEFRELGRVLNATHFKREFQKLVESHSPHIAAEWQLFARGLVYGYDPQAAAIDVRPGKPPAAGSSSGKIAVKSNRGWQSSGVSVKAGDVVEIVAEGRFALAQKPKPWICEPQGITLTYFQGRPLGELAAVIVPDSPTSKPAGSRPLPIVAVGRRRRFRAEIAGTIYLRVNDSFAWLSDNTGELAVQIRPVPAD